MNYKVIYFLLCLMCSIFTVGGQNKKTKEVYPIAFYNVENLFDTDRDPKIIDEDFTPDGKLNWTKEKYQKKLNNLAFVINQLGTPVAKGASIIGVAEVENYKVLQGLVNTGSLKKKKYQIIHIDSPDARGIDVALLYDSQHFKVISSKAVPFSIPGKKDTKTRDMLVVNGYLAGEPLCIMVNHWPSRRGEGSEALRERAAEICKQVSDSIYKANPKTGIIIMGDLNDDPKDKSTRIVLNAKKEINEVQQGGLYNTMWRIHDSGIGTLCYKGEWNLFDQIIISENLLKQNSSNNLSFSKAEVFNKEFLFQKSGAFKGYPLRTLSGATFLNGYSDHFPTLIYLEKKLH